MRSGGTNFNYFPEYKLTELANCVQFIRMLVLSGGLGGWAPWAPLGYATRGYVIHGVYLSADLFLGMIDKNLLADLAEIFRKD